MIVRRTFPSVPPSTVDRLTDKATFSARLTLSISSARLTRSDTSTPREVAMRRTVPHLGFLPASMWLSHVGCRSAPWATSSWIGRE